MARARGRGWADAKLADIHRTERAQAVEILSLKRELEIARARAKARPEPKAELMETKGDEARVAELQERIVTLEEELRAASRREGEERRRAEQLGRELEQAQAQIMHLKERYDDRVAASNSLQRKLEQEAEAVRAQLAGTQARADAASIESARNARASAERQLMELHTINRRLEEEKAALLVERQTLQARLSGLSGKIKGVHRSIAESERQVSAEERSLASMLKEMKVWRLGVHNLAWSSQPPPPPRQPHPRKAAHAANSLVARGHCSAWPASLLAAAAGWLGVMTRKSSTPKKISRALLMFPMWQVEAREYERAEAEEHRTVEAQRKAEMRAQRSRVGAGDAVARAEAGSVASTLAKSTAGRPGSKGQTGGMVSRRTAGTRPPLGGAAALAAAALARAKAGSLEAADLIDDLGLLSSRPGRFARGQ